MNAAISLVDQLRQNDGRVVNIKVRLYFPVSWYLLVIAGDAAVPRSYCLNSICFSFIILFPIFSLSIQVLGYLHAGKIDNAIGLLRNQARYFKLGGANLSTSASNEEVETEGEGEEQDKSSEDKSSEDKSSEDKSSEDKSKKFVMYKDVVSWLLQYRHVDVFSLVFMLLNDYIISI